MNFTLVLSKPEDGEWGGKLKDGSGWSGMVGLLATKQIDIGTIKHFNLNTNKTSAELG